LGGQVLGLCFGLAALRLTLKGRAVLGRMLSKAGVNPATIKDIRNALRDDRPLSAQAQAAIGQLGALPGRSDAPGDRGAA
jgi:hypothetical protein